MLFNFAPSELSAGDTLVSGSAPRVWGVNSEYGRLSDVMLSSPEHLELVPCNAVSIANSERGILCSADAAIEQHGALVDALRKAGVRCHVVPSEPGLPDLAFARDATFMTPWELIGLRPSVDHRTEEVDHILSAAASWGVPVSGRVPLGRVEGGDVCLLRPGVVAVGYSGDRTNLRGARALAQMFEDRGWRSILTPFSSRYLHLDTIFTMIDSDRAVACVEALDEGFLLQVQALDIKLVPATEDEVSALGANILSLGGKRLVTASDNHRLNAELERLGYEIIAVEIDQFTRCGGGTHCLTMPLYRIDDE